MKRTKKRLIKTKKTNGKPFVLAAFAAAVFLSSVFVTIKVATTGARLTSVENEISVLTKENEDYRRKLVNSSSLKELEAGVEKTDFTKPTAIIYIQTEEPVAKLP